MKPESKFDPTSVKNLFLLKEDYRGKLPGWISRFLGYRVPGAVPPFDPPQVPPFIWLAKIPLHVEVWIFAWIGAFGAILLVEAIMSTSTVFRVLYSSPIVITSFGASAILLFGVIESPLAQPRNFVGGHLIAALTGTAVTRLFVLDPNYLGRLNNTAFDSIVFVNGGLSVATALAVMLVLGIVHPPYVTRRVQEILADGRKRRFNCTQRCCRIHRRLFILAVSPCRPCVRSHHASMGMRRQ